MITQRHACALVASAVAMAACLDDSITGTRPLSFSMTASTNTALVGQDITFTYEATGTALQLVMVDYGDGVADTVETSSNVLEASGTLTHAYQLTGDFIVSGKAENFTGSETEEINVAISQPLTAAVGRRHQAVAPRLLAARIRPAYNQ